MAGYKIAMVAACPFPANYGSPEAIREMAQSLASRGNDIHVVTYPFGEDLPMDLLTVWRCFWWKKQPSRLSSGPSLAKLFLDLFLLVKLCSVIRRQKIDVIHVHDYEGVFLGIVAKLITGRPLLYNAVNLMSDEPLLYKFLRPGFLAKRVAQLLDTFATWWPDGFIAVTHELRRAMLARGVSPDRIAVAPCSVDLEMFEKPKNSRLYAQYEIQDHPVIMYTGTNSPIQRLDYLLRAFSLVRQKFSDARLMIVSPLEHDPDLEANRSLAAQLGVGSGVIWVQGHKLTELPDYLALASVAVISRPDMSGHPIKLLNYMAAARPIVCSAGAAQGVQHLREAFLTRDHDWEHLAEGIMTLLEDQALAEKLGTNARETVMRNFDCGAFCTPVERMYQFLTMNPKRSVERPGKPPRTWREQYYYSAAARQRSRSYGRGLNGGGRSVAMTHYFQEFANYGIAYLTSH
jgi:1,2-diacylglycerol 3-alpha-glucosyltransferase